MNDLPLDLLQSFVTFVESESIGAASKALFLTQPAVSQQLKRLEQGTAYPLFSVQGKRKVLTPYGQALYQLAKPHLAGLKAGWQQMKREFDQPANLTLRIGVRREIVERLVRRIRFEGILEIKTMPTREAVQALLDQKLDIAISHFKPDSAEVVARKFFAVGVKLITPKEWQVASLAKMKRHLDKPLIAYRQKPPFLTEWANHWGRSLDDLAIRVYCEDWHAVVALVEAGYGYSVIPDDIYCPGSVNAVPLSAKTIGPVQFYYLVAKHLLPLPFMKNLFL